MATNNYTPVSPPNFAGLFQRPANASVAAPVTGAVGGGTPQAPVALDPRGLVPVNRTQPLATDSNEAQRMMERRLGTMPPSSFSGAGAGFVSSERPMNPALYHPSVMASDRPVTTQITPQVYSQEALQQVGQQENYGGAPAPPPVDPIQAQRDARREAHLQDRWDSRNSKMAQLLARLQDRVSPERFAAIKARLDARAAGQQPDGYTPPAAGTAPAMGTSRMDYIRQNLASYAQQQPGLLGLRG